MTSLDAPDVAFTEAAVGAGIATVLFLSTLALTTRKAKRPTGSPLLPLLLVGVTGALLVYGTLDLPYYGDPEAPIQTHVGGDYLERTPEEIHVPNVVTAVLASYRGYDTLGETTVILTAGIAVLLLLKVMVPQGPVVDADHRADPRPDPARGDEAPDPLHRAVRTVRAVSW